MAAHCDELLVGWGEISNFMGISVLTLKVWRDQLELPVQPIHGPGKRKTYCATKSALNEWVKVAFNPLADYRQHNGQAL